MRKRLVLLLAALLLLSGCGKKQPQQQPGEGVQPTPSQQTEENAQTPEQLKQPNTQMQGSGNTHAPSTKANYVVGQLALDLVQEYLDKKITAADARRQAEELATSAKGDKDDTVVSFMGMLPPILKALEDGKTHSDGATYEKDLRVWQDMFADYLKKQ